MPLQFLQPTPPVTSWKNLTSISPWNILHQVPFHGAWNSQKGHFMGENISM